MGSYEKLLSEYEDEIIIEETNLKKGLAGLYLGEVILIEKRLNSVKKLETLYEELAHHKITYGDIRDQSKMLNRKFELKARRLGCEMVITLDGIIDAFHAGVCNLHEMACHFEVSNNYVLKAIEHYKMKYGLSTYHNGYVIKFEPLQVFEHKNIE
ncbi:toxin [Staphylococcus saprophyticus]|uniref:ImmA/IrrE family metallo-endopeptidase n=1 Tax=Staphylococcus saprophyticus TaxID=29385 RepID=UPI0019D217E2|nr:ImmA/IrrE family metallo-endopeptidase [Staphylococcus saprophyticus]MBN6849413.1 toxin [Staphylococcus saprophyticus]